MNELGSSSRAIVEAARGSDDPTSADRERVRRSLFARVAAGGATILVTSGISLSATAKIVLPIGVAVLAAAGGGVWWQTHHRSAVAVEVPRAVTTVIEPAPATGAQATSVAAEPTPPADRTPPVRRLATTPPATRSAERTPVAPRRLEQETELLTRVNAALRSDNPRASLALLDEYDRRFPEGLLREEALATRVIARCQLAPGGDSRREAQAFLRQHPSSPLASRVRESCASDP